MKTKIPIKLASAWVLISALNSQLYTALAQGSLTPLGPPAPIMKSLDQIEARQAITNSGAVTISEPGSYYLTRNITVGSGNAITIVTNGVTLDLNGFTISSTEASPAGTGILLNNGVSHIGIYNGHIRGGVTNNAGIYNGRGFANGIFCSDSALANVRVSRVSVSGCLDHGIYLPNNFSTAVEACTVRTVGGNGIVAFAVQLSCAADCGGYGIYGSQVSDCRGLSSTADGVYATTAQNCLGYGTNGNGVYASTAQNCYGYTTSGDGVHATTAQNCYGYTIDGTGINAVTARNCSAYSLNDTGIDALSALNCHGENTSDTGYGVRAALVRNSYGRTYAGGTGLWGYNVAIGCTGQSYSGTALSANIGNSCFGFTSTGVPQFVNHKYNMP